MLLAIPFHKSIIEIVTLTSKKELAIQMHVIAMVLWTLLLVLQPILIYYKKWALHRKLGHLAKILVAMFIVSTLLSVVVSYERLSEQFSVSRNVAYIAVQVMGIMLFTGLYFLALRNKKKVLTHTQYIIASTIALLGPAIFRLVASFGFTLMGSVEFGCNVVLYTILNLAILILCIIHARRKQGYFPYALTAACLVPIESLQLYFSLTEPLF